jgi:hypothetical protein
MDATSAPSGTPDPAAVAAHMYAADRASRGLGMEIAKSARARRR